jgi:hypothetical protein
VFCTQSIQKLAMLQMHGGDASKSTKLPSIFTFEPFAHSLRAAVEPKVGAIFWIISIAISRFGHRSVTFTSMPLEARVAQKIVLVELGIPDVIALGQSHFVWDQ